MSVYGVPSWNLTYDIVDSSYNLTAVGITYRDHLLSLTSSTPTPSITPNIPGDINNDRVVNILDYTLLSNAFGTNNTASDVNHDSTVNILDYTLLSNNFGRSS